MNLDEIESMNNDFESTLIINIHSYSDFDILWFNENESYSINTIDNYYYLIFKEYMK